MPARSMLAILVLLLGSCVEPPSGPLADLHVATDRDTYAAGSPILVSVRNVTEADAFFYHCDHRLAFSVQVRSGEEWVDAGGMDGPICPAIYRSGVLVLIPGSAYERRFTIDQPGTYRARFETATGSTAIGSEVVYSNTFEVSSRSAGPEPRLRP